LICRPSSLIRGQWGAKQKEGARTRNRSGIENQKEAARNRGREKRARNREPERQPGKGRSREKSQE
jgi:hypothetical protein